MSHSNHQRLSELLVVTRLVTVFETFDSGFARCERCGGTLATMSRRTTGRQRMFLYGCLAHHKRGTTVCENALVKPIATVDAAVQSKLVGDVLRPAIVRAVLDGVFAALQPKTVAKSVRALRQDLTAAIEHGDALAPIVAKLGARQAEREALLAEIGAADAMQNLTVDRKAIERQALAKVAEWRRLLDGDIAERRQFLREILDGPIYFTPEGNTYRFEGMDRRGRLITDLVTGSTFSGVPTGIRRSVDDRTGRSDEPIDVRPPGS
jgi:hypothetical protein